MSLLGAVFSSVTDMESNAEKSLAVISTYLNQLDAWALKYGQKAYWRTHQTYRSNLRPIMDTGLRGGGAGLEATTLISSPQGIVDALRSMTQYKIHSGAQGFAHRGSDGMVVILVTGRSIKLQPGQNHKAIFSFLSDEGLDNGDVLPPKYIMGAFFLEDDGSIKMYQNSTFAG